MVLIDNLSVLTFEQMSFVREILKECTSSKQSTNELLAIRCLIWALGGARGYNLTHLMDPFAKCI